MRVGETLAGRSPYCTIVLNDPRVSREHAALRLSGEGLWVEDLGSRNGTRVNGEPISGPFRLTAGDTVEIGSCRLEVQVADAERTQAGDTLSPEANESFVKDEIVTRRDIDIISEAASRVSEQSGEEVAEHLRSAIAELSEQLQRSPKTANQGAQLAATMRALQRRGVS